MTLTFDRIRKRYGQVTALDDFSCVLKQGLHAILGPNGSGKSSLIHILTGNLKADGGQILCDGEACAKMGARFREKMGFVPQFPGILPGFTLREYLCYIAQLKGIDRRAAGEQIDDLTEKLELTDCLDRKLGGFSGGMKQRAVIAQALLGYPELLILDEPTAGLDPGQRIRLKNLLSAYSRDRLVLFATHIVSDIEEIATDLLFLKNGRLIEQGTPESVKQKLQGRIWQYDTDGASEEDGAFGTVLRKAYGNGSVQYRIYAEESPCECAAAVAPDLEDCYYYLFRDQ